MHFYEAHIKVVVTGDDASDAAKEGKAWLDEALNIRVQRGRIRGGRLVGVREVDDEIVGDIRT